MGLAAPRKKTKISHDPNNTNWSRSTTGFGHKILSSQGWTPGSFLGARNAAHADMFTAASASHIRVSVKDDTLGLGARPKRDPLGEPTGLDAFKGLLGRLNGKSDAELQADQRKRDDIKLARYAATKWQAVRFISAGLLTQEKVDEPSAKDEQPSSQSTSEKEMKKKASAGSDSDNEAAHGRARAIDLSEDSKPGERRDKKDKKDKKEKEKEKRDKKDKKRKREQDREASENSSSREQPSEHDTNSSKDREQPLSDAGSSVKQRRALGRHMIRGRYIAQKKKALMDEKSLNEVIPRPSFEIT